MGSALETRNLASALVFNDEGLARSAAESNSRLGSLLLPCKRGDSLFQMFPTKSPTLSALRSMELSVLLPPEPAPVTARKAVLAPPCKHGHPCMLTLMYGVHDGKSHSLEEEARQSD